MQRWRERIRTDIIRIKFYRDEGEQLENYTKYKLKSSDELASVLDGKDNLFVIACNKCFKEFETVDEPDCDEFLKFAADQGKNVTGSAKFDFFAPPHCPLTRLFEQSTIGQTPPVMFR